MSTCEVNIPETHIPSCFCITPRSYQSDRTIADTDTIIMPPRSWGGSTAVFELAKGHTTSSELGRKGRLIARLSKQDPIVVPDKPILDYRAYSSSNWAHFLCYHIPMLCAITQQLGCGLSGVKIILSQKSPSYIQSAAKFLELDTVYSDGPVVGQILKNKTPFQDVLNGHRRDMLEQASLPDFIRDLTAATSQEFGGKYFVSRKGMRSLENNADVARYLAEYGYQEVYMEDFTPLDQFRLIQSASALVSVHGAGLAPFVYLSEPSKLNHLVEIMPVALMSTFYRSMADAMGVYYAIVRGKLKSHYIPDIYDTVGSYSAHINEAYSIDISALEQAIDLAERQVPVPQVHRASI